MLRLNVNMKSSDGVSIGEIAERFGLATHVLRHWESMGLLSPARVRGDRRRYDRDDHYRVAVIVLAKEAGFALEDIREMIAAPDPAARQEVLERHRATLVRRIERAQASLDVIECVRRCDHDDFARCEHFQSAVRERVPSVS